MFPTPGLGLAVMPAQRPDLRLHRRYPIALDAQYKLLNKGRLGRIGIAKTLNISTGGILIATSDPLPAGCLIELAMNWPFLLDGVCPLRLVMRGRIVRKDDNGIAVQAWRHEFRTASSETSPGVVAQTKTPALIPG